MNYPYHSGNDRTTLDIENSENYLLILGPNIARNVNQTSSSLFGLLESMASWCIQEKIIKGYNTVEDFWKQYDKKSLLNEKLIRIGYILEEHLSEKHQQCTCIKAVLNRYTILEEFSRLLKNKSFRGYISTSYDTFIETAYAKKTNKSLSKFYASSIDGAIEACHNEQPFVLKLYGDIDEPASIVLGPRFSKGLADIYEHRQLYELLSTTPALFIGFEEKDPDLEVLRRLVITSMDFPSTIITQLILPFKQTPKLQFQYISERHEHTIIREPSQNHLMPSSFLQTSPLVREAMRTNPHLSATQKIQPAPLSVEYQNKSAVEVFTAYVPADDAVKKIVETVLIVLKKQKWNLIDSWGNALVPRQCENSNELKTAHLILLLISYDFLATDFSVSNCIKEMIEPSKQEQRRQIIPIIARAVGPDVLRDTHFGHLTFLPKDGKPVIKKKDTAMAEIGEHIRGLLDGWRYH